MKFQMAKNSLFATLLRSPWWVSLALAAVLSLLAAALLPQAYRVAGALSSFPFVVIAAIAAWRQSRLPGTAQVAAAQQALATMAWPDFARRLEQAFQRDGYTVQRGSRDGVDFELERKGRAMLVCARRWKSARTGVEALRSLQAAREAMEVPDALYICLGELTDNARPFAAEHRIAIWQAPELAQALRGLLAGGTGLASVLVLAALAGAIVLPDPARAADASTAGAAASGKRDGAALVSAAEAGDLAALRRLLDAGTPIESRDARRRTALLAATHANRIEAAQLLIERGADVNAQDELQDSAFLYAGAQGRLEILRLTLRAGADLKSTNRYGGTALIPAAHHGHVETVRELLKTKIAVDHVNKLGWTALLEAVILGDGGAAHTEIVRMLVAHGAKPNLADAQGVTPLAHAEHRGQRGIAEILRNAGARAR
jgi:hypothetical protein